MEGDRKLSCSFPEGERTMWLNLFKRKYERKKCISVGSDTSPIWSCKLNNEENLTLDAQCYDKEIQCEMGSETYRKYCPSPSVSIEDGCLGPESEMPHQMELVQIKEELNASAVKEEQEEDLHAADIEFTGNTIKEECESDEDMHWEQDPLEADSENNDETPVVGIFEEYDDLTGRCEDSPTEIMSVENNTQNIAEEHPSGCCSPCGDSSGRPDVETSASEQDVRGSSVKRGKYSSKYTDADLRDAVGKVVHAGWTTYKASKIYKVPFTTLKKYTTMASESDDVTIAKKGRPLALTMEEEQKLVTYITERREKGSKVSAFDIRKKAFNIMHASGRRNPFRNGVAGWEWLRTFRERNGLT